MALQVVPKFLGNYHKKSEMECNFTLRVLTARRQTPWIHLVFWCGNSVETCNFRRVLGESLFSQNSRVSTKFPQQEIRWNFGIWSSLAYCIVFSMVLRGNNYSTYYLLVYVIWLMMKLYIAFKISKMISWLLPLCFICLVN